MAFTDDTDHDDDVNSVDTSTKSHTTDGGNQTADAPQPIAHQKTVLVNRSKWVVYLVILVSSIVAGILTHHFVKQAEKRWYEDEVRS